MKMNCFSSEDFKIMSSTISVIMGNDLKDYYKVGDEFPVFFMDEPFAAHVKGFTKEKEYRLDGNLIISFDNSIMMPIFDRINPHLKADDSKRFGLHYKFMIYNGCIHTKEKNDYEKIRRSVERLATDNNSDIKLLCGC